MIANGLPALPCGAERIAATPMLFAPLIAPEVAVIVNAPVETPAVAKPVVLLIVTTLLFADQVVVSVKSRVVLSL